MMKIFVDLIVLFAYFNLAAMAVFVAITGGASFDVGLNLGTVALVAFFCSIGVILFLWKAAWDNASKLSRDENDYWKSIMTKWAFIGVLVYYIKVMRAQNKGGEP